MAGRWWFMGVVGLAAAALVLAFSGVLALDQPPLGSLLGSIDDETPASSDPTPTRSEPAPTTVPLAGQIAERRIADPEINELSGLAASRVHPGVLYGINDSGGSPLVYAIDRNGDTVARLRLEGITARDWEALAPGWDADGRPTLWIGGIGDNRSNQTRVRVLEIAEPAQLRDQSVSFRQYWLTYSDGPHNAEALLVHPTTGEISVVTKGSGTGGGIYRPTEPLRELGHNQLQRVLDTPGSITDGAWELSPAGEPRLVLIDYWRIHRLSGTEWISELGPLQLQREALAWPWLPDSPGGDTVLLGSEGTHSTILTAQIP